VTDLSLFKNVVGMKMTDSNKKLIQERLDCINKTKNGLNDIIFDLQRFCIRCSEDRIYCVTCVIPLTRKKLENIFL
jgi:hypothetical protein